MRYRAFKFQLVFQTCPDQSSLSRGELGAGLGVKGFVRGTVLGWVVGAVAGVGAKTELSSTTRILKQ